MKFKKWLINQTLRLSTAFTQKATLKNRIKMLYQNPSLKVAALKFGFIFPLAFFCALFAFSFYTQPVLFPVEQNEKTGFINAEGKLVIPCEFEEVKNYENPYIIATRNKDNWQEGEGTVNEGWGVMNFAGRTIIPFEYDDIHQSFSEGLIAVRKGRKWAFFDENGQKIIDFEYDFAKPFRYGLAAVRKGEKFGFIDKEGQVIIPFEYHKAFSFSPEYLRVETLPDYEHLLINRQNQIQTKLPYYHTISELHKGLALVSRENFYGCINEKGQEVIALQYKNINIWNEDDLLSVSNAENRAGYLNREWKVVIPLKYSTVRDFKDGVSVVAITKNKKWKFGVIDKNEKIIIPFIYDEAGMQFSEGLLAVQKGKKYGFIDKKGQIIIPFQYDFAIDFSHGLAKVMKGKDYFYIDKQGKIVFKAN
jgi:hypothetical protein